MLASLVTAVIVLIIQQNEEYLVHALSRPISNVRVESAQRFVTKEEQEKFADLLNETIKYDKLYLLQAMSKFEELLELDEWYEIEKKHTIH